MKHSRRVIDWIKGVVFVHLAFLIKVIFTINQVFYGGNKMRLKRKRDKEYPWVSSIKSIFMLPMYTFNSEDGKEYAVVARCWGVADYYYAHKLNCKRNYKNRYDSHPFFKNDGTENIYHKPFWCYGRVYEVYR